jgi:peptidyl-prolyl cis-trans isomerase C
MNFIKTVAAGLCLLAATYSPAAEKPAPATPVPKPAASLFGEEILAKGKGLKVTRAQLDEAMIAFKANVAAQGRAVRGELEAQLETQMLERLIATQLMLAKATETDKTKGQAAGEQFIADLKKNAGSEEAFARQLLATGMSYEQFHTQILEQAIVKEVIDREIKAKQTINDEQIKQYYEANGQLFDQPELVRVSHLLLSTVDRLTGQPLSQEQQNAKREKLAKILERARKGDDFTALVKEFSEDPTVKENNGEYKFARARDQAAQAMVAEFEAAAFSLTPGQISDIVTSAYGLHIIKLHEKIPAQKLPLEKVSEQIRETLVRQEVEKQLEPYVEQLKKEAGAEVRLPKASKPAADTPKAGKTPTK